MARGCESAITRPTLPATAACRRNIGVEVCSQEAKSVGPQWETPPSKPKLTMVISSTSIFDFVKPVRSLSARHMATARLTELLQRQPQEVSQLLAERQLLRGVTFRSLVGRCGEVFKVQDGIAGGASAESFAMSEDMAAGTTFKAFISHSWQGNPRFKGISLISHALCGKGPLLLLTAASATVGLMSMAALLWYQLHDQHEGCIIFGTTTVCGLALVDPLERQRHRLAFANLVQLVATTLLLLVVFTITIFRPHLLVSPAHRYFLDKCSVNQTDPWMKHRGIIHLCEYVQASDVMVVLWDPTYLRRLWCVCELALFSRLSPDLTGLDWCCLWVHPAAHGLALLSSFLWFTGPLGQLMGWPFGFSHSTVEWCVGPLLFGSALCALLWWRRAARHILRDLEVFNVRSAECVSAEDGRHIRELISWLWSEGLGDDGLDSFEGFVRGPLRDAVARKCLNELPALRCLLGPLVVLQLWLYIAARLPQQLCSSI